MEDAMIINKASEERGLAHGSIYKSEFIELEHETSYFARKPDPPDLANSLGIAFSSFNYLFFKSMFYNSVEVGTVRWPFHSNPHILSIFIIMHSFIRIIYIIYQSQC